MLWRESQLLGDEFWGRLGRCVRLCIRVMPILFKRNYFCNFCSGKMRVSYCGRQRKGPSSHEMPRRCRGRGNNQTRRNYSDRTDIRKLRSVSNCSRIVGTKRNINCYIILICSIAYRIWLQLTNFTWPGCKIPHRLQCIWNKIAFQ